LQGFSFSDLLEPVPFGIAAGLFVGKTIGIFAATWLAIAVGIGIRPEGATWTQIAGVGMLGGIGFTMSLFIGMLAFPDPAQAAPLRLGVLAGSLVSAVVGYMVLRAAATRAAPGR
jgi:NhaA family Na+:H+ antiporter